MEDKRSYNSKKKEIINKYNSTSHFYDERYRDIQKMKYDLILKHFTPLNKIILDAGCGTGLLFSYIVEKYMEKRSKFGNYHYIGIDISIKMLNKFKNKINDNHKLFKDNIDIILADLDFLPFRIQSFNSFFSITSFQNLPMINNAVIESIKTLKTNAILHISILKKKIKIKEFKSFIENYVDDLEFIDIDSIEDFIILGKKKPLF
ncbi:MAG: class I SAM-dependent methyltransferase [Candidatus Lokiarchaeota archaeon]|nr:class I SAM-dependent methyltransferase [Candidatus Lokiarchaeota archaeon]